MIDYIEVVGLFAGFCSTFATVPQIIKVWMSRSAHDVSLFMFIMAFVGTVLWIIYGLMVGSISLIIANIISCLLVSCMLIMKFKFDKS